MNQNASGSRLQTILCAALPQETGPFKRKIGGWRRVPGAPTPAWTCLFKDCNLLLLETGMGSHRLGSLIEWALTQHGCDLLISFGFGGGLTPGMRVGDLCLCDRFVRWDPVLSRVDLPGLAMDGSLRRELLESMPPLKTAMDVTTPRILSKQMLRLRLAHLTGNTPTLVDMETHALATFAQAGSIPFLALRSISDPPEDELDFDLSAITNENGQLKPCRLVAALLGNPLLIRSFFRLWHQSGVAGEVMGNALKTLISLPPERLAGIIENARLEAWAGEN